MKPKPHITSSPSCRSPPYSPLETERQSCYM